MFSIISMYWYIYIMVYKFYSKILIMDIKWDFYLFGKVGFYCYKGLF